MTNDAPGVFTRRNVVRRRVFDVTGEPDVGIGDELVAENHARTLYQPFIGA